MDLSSVDGESSASAGSDAEDTPKILKSESRNGPLKSSKLRSKTQNQSTQKKHTVAENHFILRLGE